jgi:hypothetical protein
MAELLGVWFNRKDFQMVKSISKVKSRPKMVKATPKPKKGDMNRHGAQTTKKSKSPINTNKGVGNC